MASIGDINVPSTNPSGTLLDFKNSTFAVLKDRIRTHYDLCSSYYYSLWGEHIHHGYFLKPSDTKEEAQTALIELLLSESNLERGVNVLDVGCGVGGTSRYLARTRGCRVTGLTISGEQVRMARKLSGGDEAGEGAIPQAANHVPTKDPTDGTVRFVELDAEKMGEYFGGNRDKEMGNFDAVWISEALSHFPNKQLFFRNAFKVLQSDVGAKLVLADWFRAEELSEARVDSDIKPIEDGMLLAPLCTVSNYVSFAEEAGFTVYSPPQDISQEVAKTWDISWSLVSDPAIWKLALTTGSDFVAFLKAFQAMRTGYRNGTFRYAVIVFEKKS